MTDTPTAPTAGEMTEAELAVYRDWFYRSLRTKPNLVEHDGIWSRFERVMLYADSQRIALKAAGERIRELEERVLYLGETLTERYIASRSQQGAEPTPSPTGGRKP